MSKTTVKRKRARNFVSHEWGKQVFDIATRPLFTSFSDDGEANDRDGYTTATATGTDTNGHS